jgi:hypothetical protein
MKTWEMMVKLAFAAALYLFASPGLDPGSAAVGFDWPGPTLTVARTDPGITLSWPIPTDPGFVLECSTEAGSWYPLGLAPVPTNGCWQVVVPRSNAYCWFRLHKPIWAPLKIR